MSSDTARAACESPRPRSPRARYWPESATCSSRIYGLHVRCLAPSELRVAGIRSGDWSIDAERWIKGATLWVDDRRLNRCAIVLFDVG